MMTAEQKENISDAVSRVRFYLENADEVSAEETARRFCTLDAALDDAFDGSDEVWSFFSASKSYGVEYAERAENDGDGYDDVVEDLSDRESDAYLERCRAYSSDLLDKSLAALDSVEELVDRVMVATAVPEVAEHRVLFYVDADEEDDDEE